MDFIEEYYKEKEKRIHLECELEALKSKFQILNEEYSSFFDYFNDRYTDEVSKFLKGEYN